MLDVGLVTVVELVPVCRAVVVDVKGPDVTAVDRVVEVVPTGVSIVPKAMLVVDEVVTSSVGPVVESEALGTISGTAPLDSMTLPRTIDTAPHDSANATIRASTHPPINLDHVGIQAVCHRRPLVTLWPRLGIRKPDRRVGILPSASDRIGPCRPSSWLKMTMSFDSA